MLIKCPECELQVSDKALSCPHCGYPLKLETAKPRKPRTNKRKRLPNGFGQISEIKGQALRKPFRAMVTVGKTPEGKLIRKLLRPKAYFETYNDAYAALMEYNKNPFDFSEDITIRELYDRWSTMYYPKLETSGAYETAWKYCTSIYDLTVHEVRIRHVKYCLNEGTITTKSGTHTATPRIKIQIKTLLGKMFDYAIENEIVEKNPARSFKLDENTDTEQPHIDFADSEMKALLENVGKIPYLDLLIIQCYTGLRPSEIGNILLENVHLESFYFVGGMKTDSGKERTIPIHYKIMPLVQKYYDQAVQLHSDYLFNYVPPATKRRRNKTAKLTYGRYKSIFDECVAELNLNPEHRPHDGRVQFVTQAKQAGLNDYAIKRIVGHKIKDITEAVYTKRDVKWLKEEIDKIP